MNTIPIDTISNVVDEALDALIEHYQQPIHVHNILDDLDDHNAVDDTPNDSTPSNDKESLSPPPFVAALLRRIQSSISSSSNSVATREEEENASTSSTTVNVAIKLLLLCGYHDKIRPLIAASLDTDMDMDQHQNTSNSAATNISIKTQRLRSLVVVLKHYEMLVVQSSQTLTVGATMSTDLDTDKSWSSIATIATAAAAATTTDDDTSTRRLNVVLMTLLRDIVALQQQLEQQWRFQPQQSQLQNENDTKNDNDTQSMQSRVDDDNDSTRLRFGQAQINLWRLVHATISVYLEQVLLSTTRGHESTTMNMSTLDEADHVALRHCICVLLGTDPSIRQWTYFDLDASLQSHFVDAATQYHATAFALSELQPNVGDRAAAALPQSTLASMPAASYHRDGLLLEHVGLLATKHDATSTTQRSVMERQLSIVHARIWTLLDHAFSPLRIPGQSTESRHSVDCPTKQRVLDALNWNECAASIKLHFFGTDSTNSPSANSRNTSLAPKQRLHLGHIVPDNTARTNKIPNNNKAYHVEKLRFWAALHFCALPSHVGSDGDDMSTTTALLDYIIPIVYELINSPHVYYIQWGAVILHRLLTSTSANSTKTTTTSATFGWSDVVLQNFAVMLSSAIEQHRVGATLALLGAAQRAVLQVQFDSHRCVETGVASIAATKAEYDLQLAKTLQSWLLILDRNSRHYVKDHLIWGLLWGGILPLLYDAACLTLSRRGPVDNAVSSVALAPTVLSHCVELGRLGLSALLSVLREESGYTNLCALTNDIGYLGTMGALSDLDRNDSSSDGRAQENERQWYLAVSVHTAALTALSNLIVAAHVMMHRHAGKVVCELVAYHCKLLNLQGPNLDTNGANSETTGYNETTATANLDSKSALYRHDISALQQLALHTASVAVVVCGDSAQSILDRIAAVDDKNGHECNGTNESDNYDDHVLHTVTLIRHQAKAICSLRTAN